MDHTPQLARAISVALCGPGALGELRAVLALIVALDKKLGSPDAAKVLRAMLHAEPAARPLLRFLAGPSPQQVGQRFARLEGRKAEPHAAVLLGRTAPAGAISVQAFLDPITRQPLGRPASPLRKVR